VHLLFLQEISLALGRYQTKVSLVSDKCDKSQVSQFCIAGMLSNVNSAGLAYSFSLLLQYQLKICF
jgi:hypothetical protein